MGRPYPHHKVHLLASESKSRSQRGRRELENHSTGKQWIRQTTDKHMDKSKTAKIHATALAASDMMPQRQPRLWPHSHCGCSLWFTRDGKTGALWTLLDENNSLAQDQQNSVFKYLKVSMDWLFLYVNFCLSLVLFSLSFSPWDVRIQSRAKKHCALFSIL